MAKTRERHRSSRPSRSSQSATGSVQEEARSSTRRRRDVPASSEESPLNGAGAVSYDAVPRESTNTLSRMTSVEATEQQYEDLIEDIDAIEGIVRHHLRLSENQASCAVLDQKRWTQGAFNICIPVKVSVGDEEPTTLVFRCPKPHCVGEDKLDEKIRAEVGTHVWMERKCPEIRIPHLYGFGFSDGRHYTHIRHRSIFARLAHAIRRFFWVFSSRILSRYTHTSSELSIPSGYILTEYIGPEIGQPLSSVWANYRDDRERRKSLFQGLSRIILSLARVPQPRIGSFQFNDNGSVTLSNRYLSSSIATAESQGVDSTIDDDAKHTNTDDFADGLLRLHENRFVSDMTLVQDKEDCRRHMAGIMLLRALSHRHLKREYRNGPYLVQLTDLSQSDIFVDDDWNVTCLMDLEWIASLPVEMLNVPSAIAGGKIDELVGDKYSFYAKRRREFVGRLREAIEENEDGPKYHEIPIADLMDEAWKSKGMWFWQALTSMSSLIPILDDHLSPKGRPSSRTEKDLAEFWCEDAEDVMRKKLSQRADYD